MRYHATDAMPCIWSLWRTPNHIILLVFTFSLDWYYRVITFVVPKKKSHLTCCQWETDRLKPCRECQMYKSCPAEIQWEIRTTCSYKASPLIKIRTSNKVWGREHQAPGKGNVMARWLQDFRLLSSGISPRTLICSDPLKTLDYSVTIQTLPWWLSFDEDRIAPGWKPDSGVQN